MHRQLCKTANRKGLLLTTALALFAGCVSSKTEQRGTAEAPRSSGGKGVQPLSAKDPCAERLHELCGPLLMYYALHKRLPERLDELRTIAGPDPNIQFMCPHSGKAYTYDPIGISWPAQAGRAVIYDPEPSHAGMRWTAMIEEGSPGTPLVTRIVAFPESRLTATPVVPPEKRN